MRIAKKGQKIVFALIALFLFLLLFFDLSFSCASLLLLVIFIYKDPEREIDNFDDEVVVSPADLYIQSIFINEDNKKIEITCKKSIFSTGVLRAMMSLDKIDYEVKNGLIYANDENAKSTKITFAKDVKIICKNGFFTKNINIDKTNNLLKGQRFGFMFDGEILIELPYHSELLISLGDKILANSNIAKIGE